MSGLTREAMRMVGFSHFESKVKKNLDGATEESPQIEVFQPGIKVEDSKSYSTQFGEKKEYLLRKFTLADGTVLIEDVQSEVLWGSSDPKSRTYTKYSTVYMALKDENGSWIKKTLWVKMIGRGYYGWEMEDLSE